LKQCVHEFVCLFKFDVKVGAVEQMSFPTQEVNVVFMEILLMELGFVLSHESFLLVVEN